MLFKKVLVSSRPFMYMSASPSCASLTAIVRRGGVVRLVDDAAGGKIHADLGRDLADGGFVADQRRVHNAHLLRFVHGLQHGVVPPRRPRPSRCLPQLVTFAIKSSKFITLHLVRFTHSAAGRKAPIPVKTITPFARPVKAAGPKKPLSRRAGRPGGRGGTGRGGRGLPARKSAAAALCEMHKTGERFSVILNKLFLDKCLTKV